MEEVGVENKSENVEYNGKITWFVLLSAIVAATGGLLFGYDIGVTGGVTSMEPFLEKFFPSVYNKMEKDTNLSNYCKFDSQLLTAFTSSLYVSGFLASFLASPVTRKFGRRVSILIGGFAFFYGGVIGGASLNIYMLITGRLLLGAGIGFCNQSVPLYLSEIAPSKYRGGFNIGFQLCVCIGTLSAYFTNYGVEQIKAGWRWRISLSMAAVPAAILVIGGLFLPETPNSLIQHEHDQHKVKKMLQRIRGIDDIQLELDDLISASKISNATKHPFKNILLRKYRPQFVMSIAIPFFQQMTGINMISFYAPILFRTIGSGESSALMSSIVIALVGSIMTLVSLFIVDKVGRRILFLAGGVLMLITQVMIGGIMHVKLEDKGTLGKGYSLCILILLSLYLSGFGFSWGPLGNLVPSEIFPLGIRSAAQSINIAVGFLTTFLVAQTFLTMLCHFKASLFFFFGMWVLVMTVFVYVLLPETKDVPIEKMDKIWREHRFWKRFLVDSEEYENRIEDPLLS